MGFRKLRRALGPQNALLSPGARRAGRESRRSHEIFMLVVSKRNRSPSLAQISRRNSEAGPITGNTLPPPTPPRPPHGGVTNVRIKSLCGLNKLLVLVLHQTTFHGGLRHGVPLYQTLVCHGNQRWLPGNHCHLSRVVRLQRSQLTYQVRATEKPNWRSGGTLLNACGQVRGLRRARRRRRRE